MLRNDKPIRTFLACSPSPEVRGRIIALQETLKKQIPAGIVSWVKPESIHLTLKFLGNISPVQKNTIQFILADVVATQPVFHLSAEGVGAFPGPSRPKVIWIGLRGETEMLLNLQQQVDRALATSGFPEEDRPFQGHLTLGRVKKTQTDKAIEKSLSLTQNFKGGQFQVDHLAFFQSELTPSGAIYTLLHAFPLSASGPA